MKYVVCRIEQKKMKGVDLPTGQTFYKKIFVSRSLEEMTDYFMSVAKASIIRDTPIELCGMSDEDSCYTVLFTFKK